MKVVGDAPVFCAFFPCGAVDCFCLRISKETHGSGTRGGEQQEACFA